MTIIDTSVDPVLVAAAVVIVPTIWYMRRLSQQPSFEAPYRSHLTLLLALHTLYVIYLALIHRPPNIFTKFKIPFTAPPDVLRATFLKSNHLPLDTTLPPRLEDLLTHLSSFDLRTFYVRFGHEVLQQCTECQTLEEYALFALPLALQEYLREALVVGLLTITGSLREGWRVYAMTAITGGAMAEAWYVVTSEVELPTPGEEVFMWHDKLWLLRQAAFLVIPITVHFLPARRPQAPASLALSAANHMLSGAQHRLQTLRYTRAAVMRDPTLHASARDWWARQRVEGEWAREDEGVRRMAEKLGQGFDEDVDGEVGRLRVSARHGVKRLMGSVQVPTPIPQ